MSVLFVNGHGRLDEYRRSEGRHAVEVVEGGIRVVWRNAGDYEGRHRRPRYAHAYTDGLVYWSDPAERWMRASDFYADAPLDAITITDHEFLPVAGHPDDDECTYRSDGTDATYCGESEARHRQRRPEHLAAWSDPDVWDQIPAAQALRAAGPIRPARREQGR